MPVLKKLINKLFIDHNKSRKTLLIFEQRCFKNKEISYTEKAGSKTAECFKLFEHVTFVFRKEKNRENEYK